MVSCLSLCIENHAFLSDCSQAAPKEMGLERTIVTAETLIQKWVSAEEKLRKSEAGYETGK